MRQRIVLIDGHSILNRAFYGLPDLTNSEGLHTNAVYGFLTIMFKVLDEEKAAFVAVAFDRKEPTFRHEMYPEYKGTRHPMPEELHEQVPLMKEMLKAMQIPVLEQPGYEADDILGTVSRQMEDAGLSVTILSGDRDLLQLATDEIRILIPKTKMTGTEMEEYDAKDVLARYQVTPQEFIDVKALMGDTSDNIPGVPSIGEKTATALIVKYHSIENAYAHIDEITPPRAQKALREHYDLAKMSKKLAAIDLAAPVTLKKEDAKIDQLYTQEALQLCRRLEFKNLLGRFEQEEGPEKAEEQIQIREVGALLEAAGLFSGMKGERIAFLVFDGEEGLFGAALACSDSEAVFFRCGKFLPREDLGDQLSALIASSPFAATMQLKEQLPFLRISRDEQGRLFDASIAAYLVNPLKEHYDSQDIARDYLGESIPSRAELFEKDTFPMAASNRPDELIRYACRTVCMLYRAAPLMSRRLDEMGMASLFSEIEMPLVFTLSDMEQAGIRVEAADLKEYSGKLGDQIKKLEAKIYEQAGEVFNINSPKQLGEVLFEKMKLPHGKKTKTGYSTAADVLEKLAPDYPVVADVLEYRQMAKLKSTYADALGSYIREDGRIHGKFLQTVTATGRLSSAEPNLQNIPVRMEMGRQIRKVFVPEDGFVFLDADYSQIELRVLASLANDEDLIRAYQEAQDIHTITASKVFHVPVEEVTPQLRRNAKAVNFGIIYGISSFGLSQNLSISRAEAQEYIEEYFQTYPGIRKFLDQTVADAKKNGYVTTISGRRRPMPELSSSNFSQRQFGERVAMNAPIQGSAADIIKIAMNRVNRYLKDNHKKSRLILQVHDELLVETALDELEEVREMLVCEMQNAVSMRVRLEVDVHEGKNWYEAK